MSNPKSVGITLKANNLLPIFLFFMSNPKKEELSPLLYVDYLSHKYILPLWEGDGYFLKTAITINFQSPQLFKSLPNFSDQSQIIIPYRFLKPGKIFSFQLSFPDNSNPVNEVRLQILNYYALKYHIYHTLAKPLINEMYFRSLDILPCYVAILSKEDKFSYFLFASLSEKILQKGVFSWSFL